MRETGIMKITLNNDHDSHNPAWIESINRNGLPHAMAEMVQEMVDEGLSWHTIRRRLRIDLAILQEVREHAHAAKGAVFSYPLTLRLTYKDIYNRKSKQTASGARRHSDILRSLEIWRDNLLEMGAVVEYMLPSENVPLVFIFLTPWQQELIEKLQPDVVCIDATHNTAFLTSGKTDKLYLTTILAKHLPAGKGVPLAFLVSMTLEHCPLARMLEILRQQLHFQPSVAVIDCSTAEALAIAHGWPGTSIWYCRYHLQQAVTRKAKEIVQKELRKAAVHDFLILSKVQHPAQWAARWMFMQHRWWNVNRTFLLYMERQWLSICPRWVEGYRPLGGP